MNPLLNSTPKGAGNPLTSLRSDGGNILMKAVGAWMRGESAQSFARSLAQSYPAFRSVDADNLEASLDKVCRDRNLDKAQVVQKVQDYISGIK